MFAEITVVVAAVVTHGDFLVEQVESYELKITNYETAIYKQAAVFRESAAAIKKAGKNARF
ncbi:hypothetical protein FACS1894139_09160 [Planctomycetales bacterium]|nr:hypothetical protein FACS1894107_07440 [Planctomycetales bacterium]GHT05411.1 hypothetical protein FACS1894139_09160 [Planctomycetales bacterium]